MLVKFIGSGLKANSPASVLSRFAGECHLPQSATYFTHNENVFGTADLRKIKQIGKQILFSPKGYRDDQQLVMVMTAPNSERCGWKPAVIDSKHWHQCQQEQPLSAAQTGEEKPLIVTRKSMANRVPKLSPRQVGGEVYSLRRGFANLDKASGLTGAGTGAQPLRVLALASFLSFN